MAAADELTPAAANARCPRCGGGFHCGARDSACACAQVPLDDAARSALRQRFDGCLCVACLHAVAAEARVTAASR